ncbi:hypothetical protein FHS43_000529 [Streptosporangium becharense]|uniref:DUF2637 domain-containing protein n=1 Tax=Streptosporangium becharense TaxID=1816182 RepID=A0A7W9IGI7_9ACTN|nr:DUF2637 domain-containing protein [Streptosporangium becharense]MBB2909283.1 hypothetical protein [Streptosporangium becharense]MBB5819698.1 hypothetical protein [Streptosporangium becharense]
MDVKSPAAADQLSRPSPAQYVPAAPSRMGAALRHAGIAVAGLGVTALTGAACVLSFEDLRALAIAGGAPAELAYLYPAGFDALLVIAMIGVLLLRGGRWPTRLQAGVILTLLLAAATAAEVATALRMPVGKPQADVVVAVAPWVFLILALWLLLLLVKHAAVRRAAGGAGGMVRAGHGYDILPFPEADLPTAEYPTAESRREWRSTPAPAEHAGPRDDPGPASRTTRPDHPNHPDRTDHTDRTDHPDRAGHTGRANHADRTDRPSRVDNDRAAHTPHAVPPGQLVHHPAAEIMLDPLEAPPLEAVPHHDLPPAEPVVGPTAAPETPEVTDLPPVPPSDVPAKADRPLRWGDLVRPHPGDQLVHPRRSAAEAGSGRVSERVETWDAAPGSPPKPETEVADRDADTQPFPVVKGRPLGDAAGHAEGADAAADSDGSPDPAHRAGAADPAEEAGDREHGGDTAAPPSGRMRSTPVPPAE